VLEVFATAELLPVGILQKLVNYGFIADVVDVLQVVKPFQQTDR
jgi:hypothetical protein